MLARFKYNVSSEGTVQRINIQVIKIRNHNFILVQIQIKIHGNLYKELHFSMSPVKSTQIPTSLIL